MKRFGALLNLYNTMGIRDGMDGNGDGYQEIYLRGHDCVWMETRMAMVMDWVIGFE